MAYCSYLSRDANGFLVANLNKFGDEAKCDWVMVSKFEWDIFGISSPVVWATTQNAPGGASLTCPSGGADAGIDYPAAGAFFTFCFSVTLGFWLLAKKAGLVLHAIRRW